MRDPQALKQGILRLTREYSRQVHGAFRPASDPDRTPYVGRPTHSPMRDVYLPKMRLKLRCPAPLILAHPRLQRAKRFKTSWRSSWVFAIRYW